VKLSGKRRALDRFRIESRSPAGIREFDEYSLKDFLDGFYFAACFHSVMRRPFQEKTKMQESSDAITHETKGAHYEGKVQKLIINKGILNQWLDQFSWPSFYSHSEA
jgi:hypothetical protein